MSSDTATPITHAESSEPADHRTAIERRRRASIVLRLMILAGAALTAVAIFQFYNVRGPWDYTMNLRARQLGALAVGGVSVGVSSVIFQTITGSRILTPGIMGFDALYILIQTVIVFVFGSSALLLMDAEQRALLNLVLLCAFGVGLFMALYRKLHGSLLVLVLVGVVLSGVFASVTSLASRMLSPTDFLRLQDVMFASFNTVDESLMYLAAIVTALVCLVSVPLWKTLDVVALGRDTAVALGVRFERTLALSLLLVTALVATGTALVGPLTFLGLVVANIARSFLPTSAHRAIIPAAALVGVVCTVAGQWVVAHVFSFTTTLSVVVNLAGGMYFLWLVSRSLGRSEAS